jgi:FkbM family methyltransferase
MKRSWKQIEKKWRVLSHQAGFRRAPLRSARRLISWRARCLLETGVIVRLPRWNLRMHLPAAWRGIAKFMFVFREDYEPELTFLEKILSPGKTFIDVGASFGIYSLVASQLVGRSGRVMSFEPTSASFRILEQNIALNSFVNVSASHLALSDTTGTTWLYHGDEPGSNSLGKSSAHGQKGEVVSTECLDNVLHQSSVNQVDVLKMDVEGAEELVLRGAKKALTRFKPIIIYEVVPERTAALRLSPRGAWDFLDRLGYQFLVIDHDGELREQKSPAVNRNVVAFHPKQDGRFDC